MSTTATMSRGFLVSENALSATLRLAMNDFFEPSSALPSRRRLTWGIWIAVVVTGTMASARSGRVTV